MRFKKKNIFFQSALTVLLAAFAPAVAFGEKGLVYPIFGVQEQYDDNIFLTKDDRTADMITTVAAGLGIEPRLKEHELSLNYISAFEFFSDNPGQDTENHALSADGKINFNDWHIELGNEYQYYTNRAGKEDTARVPRASDAGTAKAVFNYNQMDLGLIYRSQLEHYRTGDPIGSFNSQSLTYRDLDSQEHSGELESALYLWPKTALLLSGRYGQLSYDTKKKPNSSYYDLLTGLRGDFMKKGTIEGKIGYRSQDYSDYSNDFNQIIAEAGLTEEFTAQDKVEINLERTTNSTIYQQNAYFINTTVVFRYIRKLARNLSAMLSESFQRNSYPQEATDGGRTDKREDDLWSSGAGLEFQLSDWGKITLDYVYTRKTSNFDTYNYTDNLVTLGMALTY